MSNKWGRALLAGAAAAGTMAMPALAHPGSHESMSFTELAAHLATGWHLAALLGGGALATVAVLVAANRGGQSGPAGARANRGRLPRAARKVSNRRSGS